MAPSQVSEERWVFLPESVELVYESVSAVSDWADSGSAAYVPGNARRAIVFAGVEDSDGGTGRTLLEALGNNSRVPIASLYETVDTADSSSAGQSHIPVTGGRFDWRLAELAAGASAAGVRIELVGYVI